MKKFTAQELRKSDDRQLRETEESIRRQMQQNRIEGYLSASVKTAGQQGLRRSLARVLTIQAERRVSKTTRGTSK